MQVLRIEGRPSAIPLTLIPLFLTRPPAERDYILLEEAVAAGSVVVDEVGSGVVSRLLLHNLGDRPVLLVDGEQLVGARQNRILNTTILVPARTRLEIPVAFVQQGRWGRSLGTMAPAEALYPRRSSDPTRWTRWAWRKVRWTRRLGSGLRKPPPAQR